MNRRNWKTGTQSIVKGVCRSSQRMSWCVDASRLLTSFRYAVMACASMLEVAPRTADCNVAVTIGGAMFDQVGPAFADGVDLRGLTMDSQLSRCECVR